MLANPSTNTYGYAWESREAMDAYVSGPIFGALLANPGMAHVTTRDFGVLERPTEITRRRRMGPQRSRRPLVGTNVAV